MIHIQDLSIEKKGELLFDHLNIQLKEKVVIVGTNRSGKTTLLKAINGKQNINKGNIILEEDFIKRNGIQRRESVFIYIPKDYSNFFKELKVKHILAFMTKSTNQTPLLEEGEINNNHRFKDLTYIQKLILFIHVGIVNKNSIFLFDEPFLHLDSREAAIFRKIYTNDLKDKAVILTANTALPVALPEDQRLYIHNKNMCADDPYMSMLI